MSYHSVNIAQLSHPQKLKLRKGCSVRVKLGNHHNIHVSTEQHKKKIQHIKKKKLII